MSELFTIDNIMTIVGLFTGGGLGVFFTMKWQKKKAKAEADQAAAEAKQKEAKAKAAEVELAQKIQDTYQEILEDKCNHVEGVFPVPSVPVALETCCHSEHQLAGVN